ncbi:MAG TPA: hypothetical protein VFB50_07890, partial [Chloroflexota bacterium]|nr:hypothetical protein [Chloroflexota bacterium]
MDLSRRRFLMHLGQLAALGGTGLIAACQGGPQPTITAVPAAQPTTPPTTKPAAAPAASPAASPPAAASPVAGAPVAKPSPSPGAAAVASPAPVAAGGVSGKPQYQMDAQHTGRSPHAGPRRLTLLRSFNTAAVRAQDTLLPIPDIQNS